MADENTLQRYDRYIYDPQIIAAILDNCPVCYLGLQDKGHPYVVPVNYGYSITEDKLYIFFHSGKTGYKLKLLENNPEVCCTFAMWQNHPDRPYRGYIHNFRSVMAFGKARLIDFETETQECKDAMQVLFKKNQRVGCRNPKGVAGIYMFVVECDLKNVTGKSESPVNTPEDVPFPDVYNLPADDTPYEDHRKETGSFQPRSTEYLGYWDE